MRVTASAVSLNIKDPEASAAFLTRHFGFERQMSADGFVSLGRDDSMNVIFLRVGLPTLPEGFRDEPAAGVIVALVVDDLAGEQARLAGEGVEFAIPLTEEPWGERFFQVRDPNGVIIQLVEWAS
jgi:catechol 2,3-dioxygenase-like lactoylglutathione lyase family enzyme